ncbi:MAG: site-2 protease family protein [Cyanobacteria bacterium J06621_11]
MMMPILTFTGWMLVTNEPPPTALLYGLMVVCSLVLYGVLTTASLKAKQAAKQESKAASDTKKADKVTDQVKAVTRKPKAKPITREEETLLQRCFPWSMYYLQNIEYLPQAMICKGKLKGPPAEAYQIVQNNIESKFGDRFLLLLQEGINGNPFFALVPNPQAKKLVVPEDASPAQVARLKRLNQKVSPQPGLALLLAALTLLTTTYIGSLLLGDFESAADFQTALSDNPALLIPGVSYAVSLVLILGVHESGHYLATRYHKLKATLPYFIPVPFFLGTLGAFIQMRSPMPNRRALFDIGIAGPLAGLIVSLPILGWGLAHSTIVPLTDASQLLSFEELDPSRSTMLFILSKLALGSDLQASSALSLHPLAVSGSLGLIVTALNLMPVGQLDGGHIVHAMYGQRIAVVVSHVARILMLVLAYVYQEFLLWAFLLLFIPAAEPALNDVSELNGPRDLLGLVSLALLVMIILPAPPVLKSLLL